jgi:predicted Zn-dependent protease
MQRPPAQGTVNVSVSQAAPPASKSKSGLIIGVVVVVLAAIGGFMFLSKGDSKPAPAAAPAAPQAAAPSAAAQPVTAKDELNILLGLVRDGRWKEVTPKIQQLKSLSQVSAGNRQDSTNFYTAGVQFLGENNFQGASTEFEKAISADSSFGSPRFGLARTYARNGKLDTAAAVLVDGLLIAPDSGDGWLAAAEVFAENGKEEAANASLRLAVHLAQNRPAAMQFLNNANETVKSAKFKKLIETALPTLSGVPAK